MAFVITVSNRPLKELSNDVSHVRVAFLVGKIRIEDFFVKSAQKESVSAFLHSYRTSSDSIARFVNFETLFQYEYSSCYVEFHHYLSTYGTTIIPHFVIIHTI